MFRPALALAILALPAAALARDPGPEVRVEAGFPQLSAELTNDLYGVSTYRAPDRERRYRELYNKLELAVALHLSEQWSAQAVFKFEPVTDGGEGGADRAFVDNGAYVESLFLQYRPSERLMLQAGKFIAPFGYGHAFFPGIRIGDNAEDVYEIKESAGLSATWTFLDDPTLGKHDLSAAVFTLDTSPFSNTLFTRKRFPEDQAGRYRRNSRQIGGPGNDGQPDNGVLALDGENFSWAPGLAYHLSVMTRGPGVDGSAREWAYAAGATYERAWNADWKTVVFAEVVRFQNAGGRPVEDVDGASVGIGERRTFSTLGTRTSYGPWRATLGWQKDERQRGANGMPGENYLEASVGRTLPWGFEGDVGWSRTRYGRDNGDAGVAEALLARVTWKASF